MLEVGIGLRADHRAANAIPVASLRKLPLAGHRSRTLVHGGRVFARTFAEEAGSVITALLFVMTLLRLTETSSGCRASAYIVKGIADTRMARRSA